MKELESILKSFTPGERIETNWYVLTGGPSTGKTTSVNLLAAKGYKTTIEHARHYIDTQQIKGKTVEEIRTNQEKFQLGILKMQIEEEKSLPPTDMVFLDRAIPDGLAYYRFLNLPEHENMKEVWQMFQYKKVFILERLPFVKDYARTEDEAAQKKIHELIIDTYKSLGFPLVHVPVLAPEERVEYVLKNL
ncbi:MAG: ATP-binding protein [Chitinophagaceae bacterium]|nr:ATP-binding protein [Chitinophagaceae bacterium]